MNNCDFNLLHHFYSSLLFLDPIDPFVCPLFKSTPAVFNILKIELRLLNPLIFQMSSIVYPLLYIFTTSFTLSALLCAAEVRTLILLFSWRLLLADFRLAFTSTGNKAMVSSISDVLVSGNNSFPESILSWIEMIRMPFIRQNSRKKASCRVPCSTLFSLGTINSSPLCRFSSTLFHNGRSLSCSGFSSTISQQP